MQVRKHKRSKIQLH